ncbi:VOC family protein [Paenibacillus caseinilyticus]|uniref:Dioxygenase n=1 Tax=Paenibacillus mucilaginosus K02 TaxID=997761 RepID=R9UL82_9BACL|nr:VOC family protein [Paenibacillus mucilaginosus]AGN70586.1 dioxygenase [Paenibacillus mucilaginosus K02]
MGTEITEIHHVGHVVYEMETTLELYRKLGFVCQPPAYPMVAEKVGETPKPFGAANAHINFEDNFIEIVTVVQEGTEIPQDAHCVSLSVPPAALPSVIASIKKTVNKISRCLARFEGTHIVVFCSSDVTASAARMDHERVGHGNVNTVQRPVETQSGTQLAPVRLLEIEDEQVSEGRLAFAEDQSQDTLRTRIRTEHPNGALGVAEAILCVQDGELDTYVSRYQLYLGIESRTEKGLSVFDLAGGRMTIIPESRLTNLLPGETLPSLPGFVGYAVKVSNLSVTQRYLEAHEFPVIEMETGEIFVPGASLHGTALIFRQG